MSERRLGSYAESGSVGSSWGFTWRERRHKGLEDRGLEQGEGQSGLGEGSYQTQYMMLGAAGHERFDERNEELERLCRRVRDLELEARDRNRGRDQDVRERRDGSEGN